MKQEFLDILNKWAQYSNYDREQKKFNLNSYEYEFHRTNELIETILNNYDDSGVLAILTAKQIYLKMIRDVRIPLISILENKKSMNEEIEMYEMFHSSIINEAEDYYLNLIENISMNIIGKPLLGEVDKNQQKEFLFSKTDKVIKNLEKCRLDVFQKGGTISNLTKISTNIQIFPSLGNCLLALNNTEDGIYLCYINIHNSPDSYFGFFIKSNGNIFSINERINEPYKNAHKHSRNGRWTEGKADEIFPYDYIFSYGNHDYKGYATSYEIDESKLSFFNLTEEVYVPLLLAMIMLLRKYEGKNLDNEKLHYVDSLLPINLNELSCDKNELMVIENTSLVEQHKNLNLNFELDKVLDGSYDKEFTNDSLSYDERFFSKNNGQIFVDLWGEGFKFDINSLYSTSLNNLIEDKESSYDIEFVGTETRQRAQGYYILRQQLATYIRNQMREEFFKNGGLSFYKDWFKNVIKENIEKIERKIVEEYVAIQCGKKALRSGWSSCDEKILTDIYYIEDSYASGFYNCYIFNDREPFKWFLYDKRTSSKCSMIFVFQPKDYKGLEELFGELPKLVKGWSYYGHFTSGNSILDFTDAIEAVGTPFEDKESKKYDDLPYEERPFMNFSFMIGYSKRGFKQMLKEYNIDLNKEIQKYKENELKNENKDDDKGVSCII